MASTPAMFSNLIAIAMASNLRAMDSNLRAMASNLVGPKGKGWEMLSSNGKFPKILGTKLSVRALLQGSASYPASYVVATWATSDSQATTSSTS